MDVSKLEKIISKNLGKFFYFFSVVSLSTLYAFSSPLFAGSQSSQVIEKPPMVEMLSPKNNDEDRPKRKRKYQITLHNTETSAIKESSIEAVIRELVRSGKPHYIIKPDGTIINVLNPYREGYNAGQSMWHGIIGLDSTSVGIEFIGEHYRLITPEQLKTGRLLVKYLQQEFNIPDSLVLPHSAVAYNGNGHKPLRGRKAGCGMLFAIPEMRKRIGLSALPRHDPDVDADRVFIEYSNPFSVNLFNVLFGSEKEIREALYNMMLESYSVKSGRYSGDIVGIGRYKNQNVEYIFPNGKRMRGNDSTINWRKILPGTIVRDHNDSLNTLLFPNILDKTYSKLDESTNTLSLELATNSLSNFEDNRAIASNPKNKENASTNSNYITRGRAAIGIANENYLKSPNTVFVFTKYKYKGEYWMRGNNVELDFTKLPDSTLVMLSQSKKAESIIGEIGIHGNSAVTIAGTYYDSPNTHYFFVDGSIKNGSELFQEGNRLKNLEEGTRILTGHMFAGYINVPENSIDGVATANQISKKDTEKLRDPSTILRYPIGFITTGAEVGPINNLPQYTRVYIKMQ